VVVIEKNRLKTEGRITEVQRTMGSASRKSRPLRSRANTASLPENACKGRKRTTRPEFSVSEPRRANTKGGGFEIRAVRKTPKKICD